jgi:DNA-directed RNA polymerase specialized sigma24 family protein
LSTSWTLLRDAHDPLAQPERRAEARGRLIQRYEHVARRYFGGALRQHEDRDEAVNECFQNFSLRVLEGALHGVAPERGRFRPYLRACLSHLVTDYRRERQKLMPGLPEAEPPGAALLVSDEDFRKMYRDGLINRALQALAEEERQTRQVLHSILKLKMDHPDWKAPQLAEHLSGQLNRPLTAVWARQRLFQARRRLCKLLRYEVRLELQEATDEQVDEELAELDLLRYCRPEPPPEQPAP